MVLQKSIQLSNWMKSGEKKKSKHPLRVMSSGRRNSFSAKPVEQSTANLLKIGWVETLGSSLTIHLSLKYLLGANTALGRRPAPCHHLPPEPGPGARTGELGCPCRLPRTRG